MAKKAIAHMKRAPNGRNVVVYLDLETAQEIDPKDFDQYEIVSTNDDMYWDPSKEVAIDSEEEGAVAPPADEGEDEDLIYRYEDSDYHERYGSGNQTKKALADNNNPLENYGYIDKPKGLGIATTAAGLIGGPAVGLAAKAVDAGTNMSNTAAVNKAREVMGLEKLGFKDSVKAVVRDRQGQIADVKIGEEDYSVGFEALSPQGRTNLTADEANKRAQANNVDIEEIDARGKTSNAASSGLMGSITGLDEGWFGDALSGMLGGEEKVPATEEEPVARDVALKDVDSRVAMDKRLEDSLGSNVAQVEVQKPTELASAVDFYRAGESKITPELSSALTHASGTMDKTLGVTSGYRTEQHNNEVDGAKNSKHLTGDAADIDVRGWTDQEKKELVRDLVDQGLGGFISYTGDSFIHVDTRAQTNGLGNFMHNKSAANMANAPAWFQESAAYGGKTLPREAPLPEAKPISESQLSSTSAIGGGLALNPVGAGLNQTSGLGMADNTASGFVSADKEYDRSANSSFVSADKEIDRSATTVNNPVAETLDPIKSESVLSGLATSADSYAKSVVADNIRDDTPAELASKGFISRTPEQVDRIAYALAGELSGAQLEAIEAGEEEALKELANMVTSIENRAASRISGGQFDKVLDPAQYNSMMAGNLDVTDNNYSVYKDILNSNISEFYSGGLTPTSFDITNYHATYVDPSWGDVMTGSEQVGDHIFGALGPEQGDYSYVTTSDYDNYRDQIGYALGTMDREGSGTWGTTESTGYGRSSLGVDSSDSDYSTAHSREREYDSDYGSGNMDNYSSSSSSKSSSSSSKSTGTGGSDGKSGGAGYTSGGMNSPSGSSYDDDDDDYSSPVSDGYAGSKSPGGGF